ncbi:hypothetical protein Yoon_09180 [Yoonia sp. I 8.24]|nr:hypothetical protein [Yoonia sp. I 8.24]MCG3267889.1 hypothetical protein [Yoonia sp. I 8.24]
MWSTTRLEKGAAVALEALRGDKTVQEIAAKRRVDWFNNRRLLEPIGNIPPAEAEANFYAALERSNMAA